METTKSILLVEDESILALALGRELRRDGFRITDQVTSGEDAILSAREDPPDAVLMDIRLAGEMDGIEAATVIRGSNPVPILFMSGYEDPEMMRRAGALHPLGYLVKPFGVGVVGHLLGERLRPSG